VIELIDHLFATKQAYGRDVNADIWSHNLSLAEDVVQMRLVARLRLEAAWVPENPLLG